MEPLHSCSKAHTGSLAEARLTKAPGREGTTYLTGDFLGGLTGGMAVTETRCGSKLQEGERTRYLNSCLTLHLNLEKLRTEAQKRVRRFRRKETDLFILPSYLGLVLGFLNTARNPTTTTRSGGSFPSPRMPPTSTPMDVCILFGTY